MVRISVMGASITPSLTKRAHECLLRGRVSHAPSSSGESTFLSTHESQPIFRENSSSMR